MGEATNGDTPKAFDLDQLFEGTLRRLRTEAEYFSRLTEHNPELGRMNESHLVKLLQVPELREDNQLSGVMCHDRHITPLSWFYPMQGKALQCI